MNTKQVEYTLTITAEKVESTDPRFTMDDLTLGINCETLRVYYQKADGTVITRNKTKGEDSISNRTLPRLMFQVFESNIAALSDEEKRLFPINRPSPNRQEVCGIFPNKLEFKKYNGSSYAVDYKSNTGAEFVIQCGGCFSTLVFAYECMKRFADSGDSLYLIYREKDEKEEKQAEISKAVNEELIQQSKGYRNPYSTLLAQSKNIILRGAPGTGKSYLAKEIAADIISNGFYDKYTSLTDEQKKQVEFVQFHPGYDYSDFVEGLRPKLNDDGSMGFELMDGVFKKFIARARKNFEDSQKSKEALQQAMSVQDSMSDFFENIEFGVDTFKTVTGNEFQIIGVDDSHIYISIPGNATTSKLTLSLDEIRRILESGIDFEKVLDITHFFGRQYATQQYSYDFALFKEIVKRKKKTSNADIKREELKKYIFIIDEINRGEMSKIFGELFFSIDPGYRGESGAVSTQYSNMHSNPDEKFFIPENVYIIGTMNDIDRSVDSFDFAMRRRFRFVEIKANDRLEMLDALEDENLKNEAISKMESLNKEILKVEDLNENYQIGASYFLKLKSMDFDELWTDSLYPLLQDYVRGMYDEKGILERFAAAYGYQKAADVNEDAEA